MMRGLDTTVRKIRRRVFEEVARLGFEEDDETLKDRMEEIPYERSREHGKRCHDISASPPEPFRKEFLPAWRQAIFPINIMSRRLCR